MIKMEDIVFDDNPIIRERSMEVELPLSEEDRHTLMEMYQFLVNSQDEEIAQKYDLRPGVGIAAVQIGQLKRMCAIYIKEYDEDGNVVSTTDYALVNPRITKYTQKASYLKDGEGCLSVSENVIGLVPRHAKVTVEGYDALSDQNVNIVARGFLSICLQHELDHFDGHLFYDRINKEHPKDPIPNAMVID